MELQAVLVLCGVGVAGIAVLLLMGLFSTSGTSYEEAIAQQRKATTELLALAESKNKPKKNNKKAIKKLAKKEKKENAAAATGSDPESEAPTESGVEEEPATAVNKAHVEFSPDVVMDIPRDSPPNVKIRKRGKDPKVKPILLNKEDPSCVSDPSAITAAEATPVVNHFEEMHPKDEFELLHTTLASEKSQEKIEEVVEKKEKPAKAAKGSKSAVKAAPTPAPEPVKEEATRERHHSGDGPKEQRKSKKTEKKHEKVAEEPPVVEEVVPPLNVPQPSELTTDKLLKQALVAAPAPASAPPAAPAPAPAPAPPAVATPPGGKKKKKAEPNVLSLMAGDTGGVNVGELVRVVRAAPLSRDEIQILTDALLNKHHDPLPAHSEWSEGPNDPMQKMKKQLADKERALADEVEASQALQAKLKELRATLNAERRTATTAARTASEGGATLRAELHTLQTRLARLMDENRALAQEKLLSEASLVQQLTSLQTEAQAHALESGAARLEAAAARDTAIMAQQHAAELAQQLQDATRACSELDQQRQLAAHSDQRAQQELRHAQDRLAAITELQNEVQRLSSHAQAAEANVEKVKEESDKQMQQLSNEIASLGEQLAARDTELAEIKQLKAAPAPAPAQNGLPSNDQHKAAELAKVESVVSGLRDELAAAQRGARDQRDQLARLQDQLQLYQDKNNETLSAASEAQYAEVARILRGACPRAAPAPSPAPAPRGHEWLQAFADNLKRELEQRIEKQETEKRELHTQTAKPENRELHTQTVTPENRELHTQTVTPENRELHTQTTVVDERVPDLQAQNEHLQALVDKYKNIIDDTEGVLSRLQQNVTTEEQRWAQQLADKQRELDELRLRTVAQLQSKIDALEAQLAQAASNHTHSFADAERSTEERLMAGLSDKHTVDVCNGPSQVGLDK